MIHVLAYSGGADSGALSHVLAQRGINYTPVFCDTGWEHPMTLAHIDQFNARYFRSAMIVLRSDKYDGMRGLVQIKGRVPSAKARFCTEQLKVLPMIDWIKALDDEVTVYQGIRADESESRGKLPERQWSDDYDAWIERPILHWTKAEVFAYHKAHDIPINPLYRLGAGRVGCFPCVLVNQAELRRFSETMPEVWDRVRELEAISGRTFFEPTYIPERFCTGSEYQKDVTRKDRLTGEEITEKVTLRLPTVDDVWRYVTNPDQTKLDDTRSACMSIYNLCE